MLAYAQTGLMKMSGVLIIREIRYERVYKALMCAFTSSKG